MALSAHKVTADMLVGKGNTGQAMEPGFTYQEQQRVMDEIPKEIIVPAYNALIDALEGTDGAEGIGISATGITATNVEGAVAEVKAALDAAVIGAGAVATAGSQNQVYRKYSGADYAAEWAADGGFETYTHSKASTVHTLKMTSPKSKNHILNSASTATVNGITFTVNADKTVTVNGTATGAATIYLMGEAASEVALITLVANREYAIKGTGNAAISIDLINDETVLKSVASADGTYTPSTAVGITAIALTVASGNTISNVTVSPMLETGDTCSTYEQYGANSNGNIKFVATADFAAGDTWVVNGRAFTAQTLDGEALTDACFVSGAIVTCFVNGTVLNFKGGGAKQLNFSVVGSATEPASPTENMIWIATAVAITDWQFKAVEPTVKSDGNALESGDVWVKVGYTSPASFNSLTDFALFVYPIGTYQYDGSAWIYVPTKIYQSSEWVGLAWVIYEDGSQKEALTAWTSSGGVTTFEASDIKLADTDYQHYAGFRSSSTIDLTPYSSMKVVGSVSRTVSSGTLDERIITGGFSGTTLNTSQAAVTSTSYSTAGTSAFTHTTDISALSGSYYIGGYLWQNGAGAQSGTAYITYIELS